MLQHFKAPELSQERKRGLILFLESNDIKMKNLDLLNLAFIHTSFANEVKSGSDNNERLEFLGDSVLGFITADYLFNRYGEVYHEGNLSKIKSAVVSENSLSEVATRISIDKCLLLGQGELLTGGAKKKAILADCVEAVIASIFLDSGIEEARKFVLSFMPDQIERFLEDKTSYKDYKSILQEYYQKKRGKIPQYELVGQEGPDHDFVFSVIVKLGTKVFGPGKGKNKKSAEQDAARIALEALHRNRPEVPVLKE